MSNDHSVSPGRSSADPQDSSVSPAQMAQAMISSPEAIEALSKALAGPLSAAMLQSGLQRPPDQTILPPHQLGQSYQLLPVTGLPTAVPSSQFSGAQLPSAHGGTLSSQFPARGVSPSLSARLGPYPSSQGLDSDCGTSSLALDDDQSGVPSGSEPEDDEDGISLFPRQDEVDGFLSPSEETKLHPEVDSFVGSVIGKPLSNKDRTSLSKKFPPPGSWKPRKLDPSMKLLVGKSVVSHDKFLQKLQALSSDAAGPVASILSKVLAGEKVGSSELCHALKQSLTSMGNFHARLTQERRGCVLRGIHSNLQHLESEDFGSGELLFGKEAVKCVKDRAEELKTLRQVKNQFFQKGGGQGALLGRRNFQGSKGKTPARGGARPPKGRQTFRNTKSSTPHNQK